MKRICLFFLVWLLLALGWGTVLAQGEGDVAVTAEVDRDTITVGDRIVYTARAKHDPALVVDWPQLASTWGDFEVLGQQPLEPEKGAEGLVVSGKTYVLTAFHVGQHQTPPLSLSYLDEAGQAHRLQVAPLPITVTSVLTASEGLSTTLDIRDLKPQASLPFDWSWLPWAGAGIALLALAAGLWLWKRRKPRAGEAAPAAVVDRRPPEEIAYEELARIAGLDLVELGRLKEHYTLAADCLRRYAEGLYGVPALDHTTAEFHAALRRARVDGDQARLFRAFLDDSDLVKFAKYRPPLDEARQLLPRARRIVDTTKPQQPAPDAAQAEES